jgi:TIR domain-containing protein
MGEGAAGFRCWIAPRDVIPGTMYADGIVHAIDESSILVLILSEWAIVSAHVGREIERAVSKRRPVIVGQHLAPESPTSPSNTSQPYGRLQIYGCAAGAAT